MTSNTLLVDAFLAHLVALPVTSEVLTTFFQTLTRLFGSKPVPDPASERQGLWGELFVMDHFGGGQLWAPYWHRDPYARFDFSRGLSHFEVKTTRGPTRAHNFSHHQLSPIGNEQCG